jgi:mannitol-1-phosphate 5-dehydrogenase
MFDKKAIIFGPGAIGRGFIGQFLHESGYEILFVGSSDTTVGVLARTPCYTVTEISDEGEANYIIDHYQAVNSRKEEEKVIEEISTADLVTCAIGPTNLKNIAPIIAKGIEARKLDYPLAVIACENAIGATDTLAHFICENLSAEVKSVLPSLVRFANSAIDRIVPQQNSSKEEVKLDIKIEKYYEWCVEAHPFDGVGNPPIQGVHFVDNLMPFIERKLFTVNTAHATAAYYGRLRGIPHVHEAMADPFVVEKVREAVKETASLVVLKHGIPEKDQREYVRRIIRRISNPALADSVDRVGRAPLRKLSRMERFVGPASQLAERGMKCDALLDAMLAAFQFQQVEGDEESKQLAKIIAQLKGTPEKIVERVCGLNDEHPLFDQVVERVEELVSEV